MTESVAPQVVGGQIVDLPRGVVLRRGTPALAPIGKVPVATVLAALKIGAGFDWAGAIKAFEGQNTNDKILEGLIAVDDVAQIVGLFFPIAAVVANDLGVVIAVEPFVYQVVAWLLTQPVPGAPQGVAVWGEQEATGIFGRVKGWLSSTVSGVIKSV